MVGGGDVFERLQRFAFRGAVQQRSPSTSIKRARSPSPPGLRRSSSPPGAAVGKRLRRSSSPPGAAVGKYLRRSPSPPGVAVGKRLRRSPSPPGVAVGKRLRRSPSPPGVAVGKHLRGSSSPPGGKDLRRSSSPSGAGAAAGKHLSRGSMGDGDSGRPGVVGGPHGVIDASRLRRRYIQDVGGGSGGGDATVSQSSANDVCDDVDEDDADEDDDESGVAIGRRFWQRWVDAGDFDVEAAEGAWRAERDMMSPTSASARASNRTLMLGLLSALVQLRDGPAKNEGDWMMVAALVAPAMADLVGRLLLMSADACRWTLHHVLWWGKTRGQENYDVMRAFLRSMLEANRLTPAHVHGWFVWHDECDAAMLGARRTAARDWLLKQLAAPHDPFARTRPMPGPVMDASPATTTTTTRTDDAASKVQPTDHDRTELEDDGLRAVAPGSEEDIRIRGLPTVQRPVPTGPRRPPPPPPRPAIQGLKRSLTPSVQPVSPNKKPRTSPSMPSNTSAPEETSNASEAVEPSQVLGTGSDTLILPSNDNLGLSDHERDESESETATDPDRTDSDDPSLYARARPTYHPSDDDDADDDVTALADRRRCHARRQQQYESTP